MCVCERERDRQTESKGKLEGTNWCVKREEEKLEKRESGGVVRKTFQAEDVESAVL